MMRARSTGAGMPPALVDSSDEESICSCCNGSGEGHADGTTCHACGGSGEERDLDRIRQAKWDRAEYLADMMEDW